VATGYYRFTYGATATADITVKYSTDGTTWTNYNPPNNVLQVNPNDSVTIQLQAPDAGPNSTYTVSNVNVIVSRAANLPAATGQAYTPFDRLFFVPSNLNGTQSQGLWSASLGQVSSNNPGQGRAFRYELTMFFSALSSSPNSTTLNFAIDPEMDVEGN
jgi:hypothetical protein